MGAKLLDPAGATQQRGTKRHQAGTVGMLFEQVLGVRQGGQRLVALDHARELLKLRQEVGAAEFDLLARAAGAQGIGVDRHGEALQ